MADRITPETSDDVYELVACPTGIPRSSTSAAGLLIEAQQTRIARASGDIRALVSRQDPRRVGPHRGAAQDEPTNLATRVSTGPPGTLRRHNTGTHHIQAEEGWRRRGRDVVSPAP